MRLDKLTTKFQEALSDAQSLALGHDNAYIEPVHLLVAMLRQEDGPKALLQRAGVNVPGLLEAQGSCVEKMRLFRGGIVDGHAPLLSGRELSHYIACGIGSDHETTSLDEGREKLRKGMFLYLREGTSARNLLALAPLASPASASRLGFASDDRSPGELCREGHLDEILRRAVRCGIDPVCGSLRGLGRRRGRGWCGGGGGGVVIGWAAAPVRAAATALLATRTPGGRRRQARRAHRPRRRPDRR